MTHPTFFLAVSAVVSAARAADDPTPRYAPTTEYEAVELEGWRVLVHKDLHGEQELWEKTAAELRGQLHEIVRRVPSSAVAKLRQVTIWAERDEPHHPCMAYHPSADWLLEHGMNPAKGGCVEIADARNFLTWTIDQPAMVLHELAHAYHDRFLGGYGNAELVAAHRKAVDEGRYAQVLHIRGGREEAYAAKNPMEYFAESTEAFFATNDFYPFVRAELAEHDPAGYKLLKQFWGAK